MRDLLARIDAATDGLCPCGATPADGSAYCSEDCRPTHVGEHTDRRESGWLATPMRWRPDLVTAAPDDDLTPVDCPRPRGRFTGSVFDRPGTGQVHVRLDDGHRYVGTDVAGEVWEADPDAVWERLERELTRPDHAIPGDPPVRGSALGRALLAWALTDRDVGDRVWISLYAGDSHDLLPPPAPDPGYHRSADGPTQWSSQAYQVLIPTDLADAVAALAAAGAELVSAVTPAVRSLQHAAEAVLPDSPPDDPRERALWLRRNRNTGPTVRPRPPRQISPRRTR